MSSASSSSSDEIDDQDVDKALKLIPSDVSAEELDKPEVKQVAKMVKSREWNKANEALNNFPADGRENFCQKCCGPGLR